MQDTGRPREARDAPATPREKPGVKLPPQRPETWPDEPDPMRGIYIGGLAVVVALAAGWGLHAGFLDLTTSRETQAIAQERERADGLERQLAGALRHAAAQAGLSAEYAEREQELAEVRQSMQEHAARVEALSRELAGARHELEARTVAATAAASGSQEVQRTQRRERDRADALARDLTAARREIETQTSALAKAGEQAKQGQQVAERTIADLRQALQQEREKIEVSERALAAARRETEARAASLEKIRQTQEAAERANTELRQTLQQEREAVATLSRTMAATTGEVEARLAAERLAGEQAHALQLAELREALKQAQRPPVRVASASVSGPEIQVAVHSAPAAIAAVLAPSTGVDEAEQRRLLARAHQLVGQRNISAARSMLERAAGGGNVQALFALAETYDPNILSVWGTVGTQGDVARARELYAKALAGGLSDADARLKAFSP